MKRPLAVHSCTNAQLGTIRSGIHATEAAVSVRNAIVARY
jgi:hypothetical protein